jgi:alpha-tubulin suppressor-like RCC1 family protein
MWAAKKFRPGYTPSVGELEEADRYNKNGLFDADDDWDELERDFLEFNDSNNNNTKNNNESLVNHQPINVDNEEDEKQIAKLMRATHLEEAPYFAGAAGDILIWGRGIDGQLGGKKMEDSTLPVLVTALIHKDVVAIECGVAHTVALTHTGDLYSWGTSTYGQTGHNTMGYQPIPRIIDAIKGINVRQISCGQNHTLALTDTGRVYSWGEGEFGQLGHKGLVQLQFPELIKTINALKVVYINAGVHHSACITENGTLYAWGRNEFHQLGLESQFSSFDTPQLVKGHPSTITLQNVTQVSCGETHTACIADGHVYTWGEPSRGKLGHGTEISLSGLPRRVEFFENKKFVSVQCGWDHTCAIGEDGMMWTWGNNTLGQCGKPPLTDRSNTLLLPVAIDIDALDRGWAQVRCGNQVTVALSKNGDLYSWGRGAAVLGHGDQFKLNQSSPPSVIEGVHTKQVLHIGLSADTCAVLVSKKPLISTNLKALVNSDKFSDVTFIVEDHAIHAHQFILAARSKEFKKLFADMEQNNANAPKKEIKITDSDFTYESFMALIEFLYTDFADGLTPEVAEKLLPVATRYGLPRLEAICKITMENNPHSKQVKWIPRSTLEADFSSMLNSKEYHDIKFAIGDSGEELYAHKALLYCRNSYFRSMFDSGMAEATKYATIPVEVDYMVLYCVLEYLYSNKTKLSPNSILELFMLSHQYRINSLKYKCEHYISQHLDEDIVLPVLQIASVYNSKVLKNQCLAIIKNHYEDTVNDEDFANLPEQIQKEVHRACKPANAKQEKINPNSVVALLGDSNDEIARDIYYDDYDSEEYYNHEDDYERYEYEEPVENTVDLTAFVVTTTKKKKK